MRSVVVIAIALLLASLHCAASCITAPCADAAHPQSMPCHHHHQQQQSTPMHSAACDHHPKALHDAPIAGMFVALAPVTAPELIFVSFDAGAVAEFLPETPPFSLSSSILRI